MRDFLFLIASARRNGNTERLARVAAESLGSAGQEWLHLQDLPLVPFVDIRHEAGRSYGEPQGNERVLAEATLRASDLVMVVPVYWYTVPAAAKLYLDYWSAWMRVPALEFKAKMAGKRMWVVTVYSGEAEDAGPLVETLRKCGEYLGMAWGGVLMGTGSKPGDVEQDVAARERAISFFQI